MNPHHYELQLREHLLPDGEWKYFRYVRPEEKQEALNYRDVGNAKHPDRWRLVPVTIEEVEEVTIEMVEHYNYGDPIP